MATIIKPLKHFEAGEFIPFNEELIQLFEPEDPTWTVLRRKNSIFLPKYDLIKEEIFGPFLVQNFGQFDYRGGILNSNFYQLYFCGLVSNCAFPEERRVLRAHEGVLANDPFTSSFLVTNCTFLSFKSGKGYEFGEFRFRGNLHEGFNEIFMKAEER